MNKEKKDRPSIEAPQAVKHPDKHPPCYRSETRNPYPLCLGGFDARPLLLFLVHLAPPFPVF